jgi:kynureninase
LRFGLTPLYLSHRDVLEAARRLGSIMASGSWDQPAFHRRAKVV